MVSASCPVTLFQERVNSLTYTYEMFNWNSLGVASCYRILGFETNMHVCLRQNSCYMRADYTAYENKAMSRPRRLRLSRIWIVSLNGIVEQQCDRCEVLEL